jgi:hypothetical protein
MVCAMVLRCSSVFESLASLRGSAQRVSLGSASVPSRLAGGSIERRVRARIDSERRGSNADDAATHQTLPCTAIVVRAALARIPQSCPWRS